MVLHAAVARLEVTFRFDIFIVQSLGGYFLGHSVVTVTATTMFMVLSL